MKLFSRKPKSGKPLEEPIPKAPIPTPVYEKLATHGAKEEGWEVSQRPPESPRLPNPHPPAQQLISRASSFNSVSQPQQSPLPHTHLHPRSSSPVSNASVPTNKLIRHHDRDRDAHHFSRKKSQPTAPVALGILRALDPPKPSDSNSDDRHTPSESGRQSYAGRESIDRREKEKRGFWGGHKDKDKDKPIKDPHAPQAALAQLVAQPAARERDDRGREPRRDDDSAELTRMIGYLTATASEDWSLVLEVCDRASSNETNAKEAVRAIRREFKYGQPPAQLSAARLWAIMLRNCSDVFISQSRTRKFLETLEELLNSSKTSPVVRERLLEVVAAAAFASGPKQRDGFKGLWRRVKPFDKPDEGMPFDTEDAMFHPPTSAGTRTSGYEVPIVSYQEPSPVAPDSAALSPAPTVVPVKKKKSTSRNRIIPADEDMRRLFQECKIGQGNASLLSQALALSKPEEIKKKQIIKEFVVKCRTSQELIYAQIPWATAGAERSRAAQEATPPTIGEDGKPNTPELTIEEQLLAALLGANAELIEALQQHADMERVAMERKAEERSRKELRREIRHREQAAMEKSRSNGGGGNGSSSRSPSPPPRRSRSRSRSPHHTAIPPPRHVHIQQPPPVSGHAHSNSNSHSYTHGAYAHSAHSHHPSESDADHTQLGGGLAPPPAAPHGPRSPAQISLHSRTPSPTPRLDPYVYHGSTNGHAMRRAEEEEEDDEDDMYGDEVVEDHRNPYAQHQVYEVEEEEEVPQKPSAKALGKRKLVEPEVPVAGRGSAAFDPDDIYYDRDTAFAIGRGGAGTDPDFEDDADNRWRHPPQQYVYDAVLERARQLQLQGGLSTPLVNGAH